MRAAIFLLTALLLVSSQGLAQQHTQGHWQPQMPPPPRGPASYRGTAKAAPAPKNDAAGQQQNLRNYSDKPGHPNAPHVDAGNRWVGHDTGRSDANYHLNHSWEHGRFPGGIGPSHRWQLSGGGLNRFWFNGWYWSVAPADFGFCAPWNWDVDEVIVYEDPDHIGWYLIYNVRLGTFIHVMFMGPT